MGILDLRQVIAALLTISMFIMLGNMIKKDHIDPLLVNVPLSSRVQHDMIKVSKQHVVKLSSLSTGPWMEDTQILKPCWPKPSFEVRKQASGYIYVTLTNGPEYHASQISNAIIVAKQLGAALVLPDILGVKAGERRLFGEVYDDDKFLTSLDGVIQVVKDSPSEKTRDKIITVRVPNRISKEFIAEKIEPLFKRHRKIRITTSHFPSSALETAQKQKYMAPYECMVMFGSLELKPELQELVTSMVRTLRHLGSNSFGKFIAVDWNAEELKKKKKKVCQNNVTMNESCLDGKEIGQFLKRIGFARDATIYLSQTGWHESLNSLREYFPNTFTKDAIIPIDMKPKYLTRNKFEFERFIDFKLCTQGDVFVPISYGTFQMSVVGIRIASGKTQIFEPGRRRRSATSATDYLSPYITRKTHTAYSCFC